MGADSQQGPSPDPRSLLNSWGRLAHIPSQAARLCTCQCLPTQRTQVKAKGSNVKVKYWKLVIFATILLAVPMGISSNLTDILKPFRGFYSTKYDGQAQVKGPKVKVRYSQFVLFFVLAMAVPFWLSSNFNSRYIKTFKGMSVWRMVTPVNVNKGQRSRSNNINWLF